MWYCLQLIECYCFARYHLNLYQATLFVSSFKYFNNFDVIAKWLCSWCFWWQPEQMTKPCWRRLHITVLIVLRCPWIQSILGIAVRHFTWKTFLNLFSTNVPLLYPLKNPKTGVFFMFSGGIEMEHWLEIG